MQERYSEEVKSILEAAQQQAVMNYQQELSCAHILVALSSSEGFFRFLRGGAHPKKKKPPSHKGTKARGTTQIDAKSVRSTPMTERPVRPYCLQGGR